MATYTDHQQRELDIESGKELDRLAARRSRTILPENLPIEGPSGPIQPDSQLIQPRRP